MKNFKIVLNVAGFTEVKMILNVAEVPLRLFTVAKMFNSFLQNITLSDELYVINIRSIEKAIEQGREFFYYNDVLVDLYASNDPF